MNMNPDDNIDAPDYGDCLSCGERLIKDADSLYVRTEWEDSNGNTESDDGHTHDPYALITVA